MQALLGAVLSGNKIQRLRRPGARPLSRVAGRSWRLACFRVAPGLHGELPVCGGVRICMKNLSSAAAFGSAFPWQSLPIFQIFLRILCFFCYCFQKLHMLSLSRIHRDYGGICYEKKITDLFKRISPRMDRPVLRGIHLLVCLPRTARQAALSRDPFPPG